VVALKLALFSCRDRPKLISRNAVVALKRRRPAACWREFGGSRNAVVALKR